MPKRSRSGSAREEGSEIKDKILAAAESVFARYGLHGASTAMIATAAGISKPHIYYYFESKEDLYREVLSRALILWQKTIPEFDLDTSPADFLAQYIRARLAFSRTHAKLSRMFANEICNGAPILRRHIKTELSQTLATLSGLIDRWAAAGLVRPVNSTHFFLMLWAMTQSYADAATQMELLLGKGALDRKDFQAAEETITSMVFGALGLARG